MLIDDAVRHYKLGSQRTLKRRLAATGLPVGERTREGRLTPEAVKRLAEIMATATPVTVSDLPFKLDEPSEICELRMRLARLEREQQTLKTAFVDFCNAVSRSAVQRTSKSSWFRNLWHLMWS